MKKTKVISILIILLALTSLHSCREVEMDSVSENKIVLDKNQNKTTNAKNDSDSLNITPNSNYHEDENQLLDPPPKDRDHW